MKSLPGHDVAIRISPCYALLGMARRTTDARYRMQDAALCHEVRRREGWIWYCRSNRSAGSQGFASFKASLSS